MPGNTAQFAGCDSRRFRARLRPMLNIKMPTAFAAICAGLFFAGSVLSSSSALAASGLMPHRAVYAMELIGSADGSDIASVKGRLVLEWQGSACEGFVTSQRIVNRMGSKQGNDFVSDFRVNSWESATGDAFTFSMVHYINGNVAEEIAGEAERGSVAFSKPEPASIALPGGALFPTEHIKQMLDAAQAGKKIMSADLFDGSDTEHYFKTTTFIGSGGTGAPADDEAEPGASLEGVRYWPLQISYFDPADISGLPDFEISSRFYENGVSTGLVMDYGDLAIGARLISLEALPVPDC